MLGDKSVMVLVVAAIFTLGLVIGGTLGLLNPEEVEVLVVSEKIVTVEIEKPIITEKIVEVEVLKEVYRYIDESNPVHKWVDPDNQAVVYIYPEGYTGIIFPMYTLVPPVWFEQILRAIIEQNDGVMPPEIIQSIPREWLEAVAPHSSPLNLGF